jgi:hypothetical protein
MSSSEIFQNSGAAHFVTAITDRHWTHAVPPTASQNRVIPLIWLQFSSCAYAPRTREKTRHRTGKLSRSEMLFIMVLFHLSSFKHFKAFYHYGVGQQYRGCFGDIPHYDRFVSLMPRLFAPLMVLLHSLSGEETGIYFADSSKLAVCHNRRIHRHKVFEGLAARGKTSMGKAGQRFRRRSRWNGQTRVVFRAQAALRHQSQR